MQRMYILYVDIIQLFSICKSVNLMVLRHPKENYWVCICWELQNESRRTNYINWYNKGVISICSLLFCVSSTTLYSYLPFVIHTWIWRIRKKITFEYFSQYSGEQSILLFSWLEIKIFCREIKLQAKCFRKKSVFKFDIIM